MAKDSKNREATGTAAIVVGAQDRHRVADRRRFCRWWSTWDCASAARRLDAFAKCLAAKPAKMYGAYWCPHCADQKEMFESSFQYVPYVECGVPGSRDEAQACKDAGIKHFPTWEFAGGERQEGTLPLQMLGTKTGCSLP